MCDDDAAAPGTGYEGDEPGGVFAAEITELSARIREIDERLRAPQRA